jgi:demethylmenaquinone methyltransferase / 2-methoxy-6-polyprenyl-1,4-benzoquinol methylase
VSQLHGAERARYVHKTFQSVVPHYDLMNHLMTFGQDRRWRSEAIRRAGLRPNMRLLDLGAGTGDLSREALRQQPGVRVTAADFTLEMMRFGDRKGVLPWTAADARCLPFARATFDAVVSGFLLRNVIELDGVLAEQRRVLKEGGRVVILETTRPKSGWLTPLVWLQMHLVIPLLGKLVAGAPDSYRYLTESSEGFLGAGQLADRMRAAGFIEVGFKYLMAGAVAIHWGRTGPLVRLFSKKK